MHYLNFELSESGEGIGTFEAMASTEAARHASVMAEVQEVLDWARQRFAHAHGPLDDGHDWDHELQVTHEEGGWIAVALTLRGSPRFVAEFLERFGPEPD